MSRKPVEALLFVAATFAAAACNRSTPTEPAVRALVLRQATVSVDGVVVNGATVSRRHGPGASTRFEAHLADLSGNPALGHMARVAYSRPDGHGSMMDGGRMTLYDDGTHGDRVSGDGVYCYDDLDGTYGCHGDNAQMGQHSYDFVGMDHAGGESNHMLVTVNVTGN